MKIAFDMSSVMWTALLVGKDPECRTVEHEGKNVNVNTAAWGYENAVNMMTRVLRDMRLAPIDTLLVFEGVSSKSKRELIDKTYKATRDSRPPEAYAEFALLRTKLEETWRCIGSMILTQPYVEGDDILAWLADNTREDLIVVSNDGDMIALNTEPHETNAHGAKVQVWRDGDLGINKYGLFPYRLTTMYKALVGDTNDNIKGCPGFGPGKFQQFCEAYGYDGLQELQDMCAAGQFSAELHEMANAQVNVGKRKEKLVDEHPLIRLICEHESEIVRSWKLAKMHPEWVNTIDHPLEMKAGIVLGPPAQPDERLMKWYQEKVLVTAENFNETLSWALSKVAESPFLTFDIETSSADESDEWLAAQGDPNGVDQIGSTLTGFSFTFGRNTQYTVYVSVDHAETNNIRMSQAREMIEHFTANKLDVVIHNNHFELPVIYMAEDEDGTLWRDRWANNGFHGFLPRSLDTKLEASYVNENEPLGLKHRSKLHLDYEQTNYDEVTMISAPCLLGEDGEVAMSECPPGGRHVGLQEVVVQAEQGVWEDEPDEETGTAKQVWRVIEPAKKELHEVRRYKMNELPATHVFDYGCDDTICTAAQHVYYRFIMELEGTWDIYKEVEIDASYQHAKNFTDGIAFSLETCRELEKADNKVYDMAWAKLRTYLIERGWEGTVCPKFDASISVKEIKEAFAICFPGNELDTAVRSVAKVVKMLRDEADGDEDITTFAEGVEAAAAGDASFLNILVKARFKPEPNVNLDSPQQIQRLLYDERYFNLPIQIRNKPTLKMKREGKPGSPKTDELAIRYSMRVASNETKELLDALWLVRMVLTRRELYYQAYPNFIHWKTGRIHPSHNQCATNTRRASESKPNKQQLPKHQKVELAQITDAEAKAATMPRFREAILPHHEDAVVVSMDFNAQELRNIAEQSQDENLLACYVGEFLKDMHSLTGFAILRALKGKEKIATEEPDKFEERTYGDMEYDEFQALKDRCDMDKAFKKTPIGAVVTDFRARGKKTNFTTEYGAMAPKLAATMLVSEEDAQTFIDARESMFPRVAEWKEEIKDEANQKGYVTTMLGARRHLRDLLRSENYGEVSKAERQAVNFKVQGSCGEQTKLAEGRMWKDNLFYDFDAVCYGPIHDELVSSCAIKDLKPFIKRKHAAMVANYAGMKVPIISSISFGPNFGVQFEIGDEPTDEAIDAGLEAMWKALRGEEKKAA